jgi:outer membrane receptor protein involved in Fe transport
VRLLLPLALLLACATSWAKPAPVPPGPAVEPLPEFVDDAELVTAAAKRVSTIAETPQIVHVVTSDEIRQQGYRYLFETVGRVPGYLPYGWIYYATPTVLAHGINNGVLLLYDGVSLRDASVGYTASFNQTFPLEMIRRIETTTSPGGVLWGANSFVGVVSLAPKTADDLEGVEVGGGWGDGPGSPGTYRAYVMGGQKFLKGKVKALLHVSFDSWRDPDFLMRNNIFVAPPPLPRGPTLYGPETQTDPARSSWVNLNGNIHVGPFLAGWHLPFGKMYHGIGWNGAVLPRSLPEYKLNCGKPGSNCVDPDRMLSCDTPAYDRFVYVGFKDSYLNQRVGVTARLSWFNSNRIFNRYTALPPSSIVPGGITLFQEFTAHRLGTTVDTNILITPNQKLLVGGGVYYELMPEHPGNYMVYPLNLGLLPVGCPVTQDGRLCPVLSNYRADRLTAELFVDHQMKFKDLILDGGVRLQGAWLQRGHALTPLFSAGGVYRALPGLYLKANYSEGFRSPEFQWTDSSGQTIAWAPNRNLKVERSRTIMGQTVAELVRDSGSIILLRLAASYSYTWVSDFINLQQTLYVNSADIGIHAVDISGRLNLRGGHSLSLGYSFVDMADAARGAFRGTPSQWMTAIVYFSLIGEYLGVSSNLMMIGSSEDPNRWIHLDSPPQYLGQVANQNGTLVAVPDRIMMARGSDVLHDRIPPAAVWNIGLRSLLWKRRLMLGADVYNVLNATYYYPDIAYDISSGLETVPNRAPGISFFLTAALRHP